MDELTLNQPVTSLSSGVFSSAESFQELFNIGKMFSASTLVPQAISQEANGLHYSRGYGEPYGSKPNDGNAKSVCREGKPSWSGQACMV